MIRLISWNIAVRKKSNQQQIKVLSQRQPDIVALQEVNACSQDCLRSGLQQMGLPYIEDTVERGLSHGTRHYNGMIASRWPLTQFSVEEQIQVPFPESVLSVKIESPFGMLNMHTTHIPPGASNGWIKIKTLEGIYKHLATPSTTYRILCGDFNTPQKETVDGRIMTWAQRESKAGDWTYKKKQDILWDLGERNILEGLAQFDLLDIFRLLHGYKRNEFSWYARSKRGPIGRRFDHIFASHALCPKSCNYIHSWREQKLSDHSAIEAVFGPELQVS